MLPLPGAAAPLSPFSLAAPAPARGIPPPLAPPSLPPSPAARPRVARALCPPPRAPRARCARAPPAWRASARLCSISIPQIRHVDTARDSIFRLAGNFVGQFRVAFPRAAPAAAFGPPRRGSRGGPAPRSPPQQVHARSVSWASPHAPPPHRSVTRPMGAARCWSPARGRGAAGRGRDGGSRALGRWARTATAASSVKPQKIAVLCMSLNTNRRP